MSTEGFVGTSGLSLGWIKVSGTMGHEHRLQITTIAMYRDHADEEGAAPRAMVFLTAGGALEVNHTVAELDAMILDNSL